MPLYTSLEHPYSGGIFIIASKSTWSILPISVTNKSLQMDPNWILLILTQQQLRKLGIIMFAT